MDIKRVLWLSDFGCSSGFATVAQNIIPYILKTKKFQIDIIGINYYGMPNEWQEFYPMVRIFPANIISGGDLFGRQAVLDMLGTGVFDLLFILQDTFIIEPMGNKIIETNKVLRKANMKDFKWIYYFPIDATPKANWIHNSVALADYPVAYTEYGKKMSREHHQLKNLIDIPHGYNPSHFKLLTQEEKDKFKHDYFHGKADNKYIVTNVNRNQSRKDLARTLQIFKLFKKQVPEAILYLHCKEQDVGGSIHEIARNFDLLPNEEYFVPEGFSEHDGFSYDKLNAIYNISDVLMTTTLGEGWGLSITEAMACKVPVIAPDHTSLHEMIEGRGTLVTAGKRENDWIVLPGDNERRRPMVDVIEYVEKLVHMHHNKEQTTQLAENAYKYVTQYLTWEKISEKWVELFIKATI